MMNYCFSENFLKIIPEGLACVKSKIDSFNSVGLRLKNRLSILRFLEVTADALVTECYNYKGIPVPAK